MSEPEQYWILSDHLYLESVKKMGADAKLARDKLLAIDIPKSGSNILSKDAKRDSELFAALKLLECYKDLIFFPDPEVLTKLKDLGYKKHVCSWLIPISELNDHFSKVCSNNIKVDRLYATLFIHGHLCMKFANEIALKLLPFPRDKVQMTEISNEIIKLINRRNYSGSDPRRYKNLLEILINDLLKGIIAFTNNEISYKVLLEITKGKTDDFIIRKLISECFRYDKSLMSSAKFYRCIYDLLALILPDRNFITETDFFGNKKRFYQSYDNFNDYKAKKVRLLLNPPRSKKRISSV